MEISKLQYLPAKTSHKRHGDKHNNFSYKVDYVVITWQKSPQKIDKHPLLFSLKKHNLFSFQNHSHSSQKSDLKGIDWILSILNEKKLESIVEKVELITQPSLFNVNFQPVSFWLCYNKIETLVSVIVEVNNTFGEKHVYVISKEDKSYIAYGEVLSTEKKFHVSPFQDIEGNYEFTFKVKEEVVNISINYLNKSNGVYANLVGKREPLTSLNLLLSFLKRPGGGIRVLALIHWQALKLYLKGVKYRKKPTAPKNEISSL